jgi:predicted esterase
LAATGEELERNRDMSRARLSEGVACWVRFIDALRLHGRRLRPGAPKRRRPSSRRFRPALHHGAWLEPRRLPSAAVAKSELGAASHTDPAAGLTAFGTVQGTVIQQPDATIVLPPNLQPGRTYPLVVAFSYNGKPSGDQYTALTRWNIVGPQLGWIVYASKQYSNSAFNAGPAVTRSVAQKVMASVNAAIANLPVDRSRIILTGMSGGGNFAEYLNLAYPGFAAAVIDNSGRIPFEDFSAAGARRGLPLPGPQSFGTSRRIAVLFASPSDSEFYGDAVQRDVPYYKSVGWQTMFVPFPGGHNFAPLSDYFQAMLWLESRPTWQ